MSEKILITGGLGYVGGRLAIDLESDLPASSIRIMVRPGREHIPKWADDMELIQGDLCSISDLSGALNGVDTVIHLAAVNEIDSQLDPDLALDINGRGTYRLLSACLDSGVKRIVYLSTFHVYGLGIGKPITEESPTFPVHPYSITHRLAEDYVNWFKNSYGFETLILRLSNGYGYPADQFASRWTLVFNDFAKQAVETGEIRLRSRGLQHRDFVTLCDVGRAIKYLLSIPVESWGNGVFNLGGESSMSILEVADNVASEYFNLTGLRVPVIPGDIDDSTNSNPVDFSISKLRDTGFMLAGNMSDEIRGTLRLCMDMKE